MSLIQWGDTHMDQGLGVPIDLIHKTCGHKFHPIMVCSECSQPLNPKEVKVEKGKGFYAFHSQVKEA